jgi:hypothetical protein
MLETVSLDSKTILVRSDREDDLTEIMDYIAKKNKTNKVNAFLKFASAHKVLGAEYKFNRKDCYDR